MTASESAWDVAEYVLENYPGGESSFWLAWRFGLLESQVMDWFRRHAFEIALEEEITNADDQLNARNQREKALSSSEGQKKKRMALEAIAFSVEFPGQLTKKTKRSSADRRQIHKQFASALFQLITVELDIDPLSWKGRSEAEIGTNALRVIDPRFVDDIRISSQSKPRMPVTDDARNTINPADRESLDEDADESELDDPLPSFEDILEWLNEFRYHHERGLKSEDKAESALRTIAARLLINRDKGYYYQLSFRNFVRSRLLAHARALGWRTRSPGKFANIDEAFAALTRERLATFLESVEFSEIDEWSKFDTALIKRDIS